MNNPETEFEKILRDAPRPKPTSGLKEKLARDAASLFRKSPPGAAATSVYQAGWFRRWWPAFAPAMVSVACMVVLAVQQMEITDLKASLRALAPATEIHSQPLASSTGATVSVSVEPGEGVDELTRLKSLAAKLNAEVSTLEQMQTENVKLRASLSTPATSAFSPEEMDAMSQARDRAFSIQCVNNMKQIGLAARVWSLDNGDAFPTNFLCMSNELSTPKILVCPADTNRVIAPNFTTYSDANTSYEFFSASEKEPNQVLCRCPIHGTIGLVDGSVQMGVAKKHPDWIVQRDGKLYLEMPSSPAPAVAPSTQNGEPSGQ